jgi:hypothetical protein
MGTGFRREIGGNAGGELARGEHIGGAGNGAAGGADRSAHDRTDGTTGRITPRGAGGFPGYRAGYRVRVPQVPHWLADAMTIRVPRHTVMPGHRCVRCDHRQNGGDAKPKP